MSFNDLAGVEVLRGPQNTLFGRNATVGGILFRTTDPRDDFSTSVEAQAGNYGARKYSAVLNLPAGDRFAFRFAGMYDTFDGWSENRFDGRTYGASDTTTGRIGMRWNINGALNWTVKADYSNIEGDGYK